MTQSEVEKRINKCISMNKCFVSLRDLTVDTTVYITHEFGRVPIHDDFSEIITPSIRSKNNSNKTQHKEV